MLKNHSIKDEIKQNLSISFPLVSSQLIYSLSSFIGTLLVAKLGEDALAASVLVSMIWITLSIIFIGLLNSVSVLVSHQFGAKNYQAISEIMTQAFFLGLIVSILIILLLLGMPFYLQLTKEPSRVIELALTYMHALLWMIPGLIFLIIGEQFLAGVNRAKFVLRISLLVVPIEILLIYALIFGKFGLPVCGIAGIGYGFAVTYTLTVIFLIFYFIKSKHFQKYTFLRTGKLNMKWLKQLLSIGMPMGFMQLIEVSTFMIATFWMAQFGTTILAAHQIIIQYLSLIVTIIFAMSQAVTIRVGHSIGENNYSSIRLSVYTGMLLNFVITAMIAIALNIMPNVFLSLDINLNNPLNLNLLKQSTLLLSISSVLILFDNFRIIGFGALRGLKDTKFPMFSSFISFWLIGLSCAYFLGFYLKLQGVGIWWGLTIGIISGALILFARLQYKLKYIDLSVNTSSSKTDDINTRHD